MEGKSIICCEFRGCCSVGVREADQNQLLLRSPDISVSGEQGMPPLNGCLLALSLTNTGFFFELWSSGAVQRQ